VISRISLLASTLFVIVSTGVAAEPGAWGPAVGGARLGIGVSGHKIRITAQNVSDAPLLLPFGALIGSQFYNFRFQIIVVASDGAEHRLIDAGSPGIVGGRLDPLVVPLLPGSSYTVEIPLSRFAVLDGSEKLETLLLKGCRLRVELDVHRPTCPLYGYPNPNMIPCWEGKLISSILRFPRGS
jgi:hypothetical protein